MIINLLTFVIITAFFESQVGCSSYRLDGKSPIVRDKILVLPLFFTEIGYLSLLLSLFRRRFTSRSCRWRQNRFAPLFLGGFWERHSGWMDGIALLVRMRFRCEAESELHVFVSLNDRRHDRSLNRSSRCMPPPFRRRSICVERQRIDVSEFIYSGGGMLCVVSEKRINAGRWSIR